MQRNGGTGSFDLEMEKKMSEYLGKSYIEENE